MTCSFNAEGVHPKKCKVDVERHTAQVDVGLAVSIIWVVSQRCIFRSFALLLHCRSFSAGGCLFEASIR